MVTDRIATFTETGILLESGRELDADIIVTATGLNMQAFGGISLTVDGKPVDLPDHVAYKGMMLSEVPNFAYAIGYTNSSWTLKIGLLCEYFCRLLSHMDANGYDTARPVLDDADMETPAVHGLLGRLRPAGGSPVAAPGHRSAVADVDELRRRRQAAAQRGRGGPGSAADGLGGGTEPRGGSGIIVW